MEEKELPEACKICIKFGGVYGVDPGYRNDGKFLPCHAHVWDDEYVCLPKDRAMIVLHYKILQALEK